MGKLGPHRDIGPPPLDCKLIFRAFAAGQSLLASLHHVVHPYRTITIFYQTIWQCYRLTFKHMNTLASKGEEWLIPSG